jgi:AcrR family transcriptional regulator
MATMTRLALSGRRRQAELNNDRILEAARAVFTADPAAPIAAVAECAGVGISALYRRYRSKEELLQHLCLEGLHRYIAEAEATLAEQADPWTAFCSFMRRLIEANTHALTIRVAGTFTPTKEHYRLAEVAQDLNVRIFENARASGVVRPGVTVDDLGIICEQLAAIALGNEERNLQLRRRYLGLFLDGLRAPSAEALSGPPPTWDEVRKRWDR